MLKEHRRLVIVPRETPMSLPALKNMVLCAEAGAMIVPAMPAFYQQPKTLDDLADFMAGKILSALGRNQDAEVFKAKALDRASALQLYFFARQLQGEKKQDEALALFRSTAKKFPDYWTSHMGLARVYSSQGDFDNAVKEVKLSLTGAPDSNKSNLENYVKRLQNKEDINR